MRGRNFLFSAIVAYARSFSGIRAILLSLRSGSAHMMICGCSRLDLLQSRSVGSCDESMVARVDEINR